MNKIASIILLAFIIQGCENVNPSESDSLEGAKKVILKEEGAAQFFYWELNDEENLWEFELGEVEAIKAYQDSLILALGHPTFETALKKEATQDLEESLIQKEENGDRINALLVHTGTIGKVRKINFLEAQILNYQISRFPLFSHPTEFHGFIARNKQEGKIRVYFASSDTEWPPRPTVIIDELDKEIENGWKLIRHLHNHYCKKEENYIGILAPSLADAQYFKMLKERYKLEVALVTNGFHTVEIESKDFEQFESH